MTSGADPGAQALDLGRKRHFDARRAVWRSRGDPQPRRHDQLHAGRSNRHEPVAGRETDRDGGVRKHLFHCHSSVERRSDFTQIGVALPAAVAPSPHIRPLREIVWRPLVFP